MLMIHKKIIIYIPCVRPKHFYFFQKRNLIKKYNLPLNWNLTQKLNNVEMHAIIYYFF